MIEALASTYILLSKSGRLLSTGPSPATMWRWSLKGIDGVKLKTYKIGGRRYTTAADLENFVARLNGPTSPGVATPDRRDQKRQAVAAERAEAIFGSASTDNAQTRPSGNAMSPRRVRQKTGK